MDGLVLSYTLVVRRTSEKKTQGVEKWVSRDARQAAPLATFVYSTQHAVQQYLITSVILGWSRHSVRHLCRAWFAGHHWSRLAM